MKDSLLSLHIIVIGWRFTKPEIDGVKDIV